jgi:hypothetical protein
VVGDDAQAGLGAMVDLVVGLDLVVGELLGAIDERGEEVGLEV